MAAISGATTTTVILPPTLTGKSPISSSSLPSSYPPRHRRQNHLRKKILKTLEMTPYPDPNRPEYLTRKFPPFPHKDSFQEHPDDQNQVSLTELSGFDKGIFGNLDKKSFVTVGAFLVGAFLFQTVCAVLIFGSNDLKDMFNDNENDSNDYKKKSRKLDLGIERNKLTELEMMERGGGEVEMDDRILEIREMARVARKQEKIEAKRRGLVGEGEGDDDVDFDMIDKNVKEKEVDGRLMKLRKSLEGNYKKLPIIKVERKEGGGDDGEAFGSLMFKKKYKYKSPSVGDLGDKPKGFGNGTLQTDKTDNEPRDKAVDGNEREKVGATNSESIAGTSNEPQYDNQASKTANSGKSSNLETSKPRGFGQESSDTAVSAKQDDSIRNGGLKGKKGGNKKSARNLGVMKSSTKTDFWWTSLPYVLAVHMQRGNEDDESGLFIIRSTSQIESGLAHTVAFEDRGDAMNFCYLLESFFEDLEEFNTNIIPIPSKELEEALKSQIMKVVVVKKGQLQLYVGQPLPEVESALRTLIEQNEKL